MGGAVPGTGFYIGFLVAPLFAGPTLGWYERSRIAPGSSLVTRVWKNLVGIALTALIWVTMMHYDRVAPRRFDMESLMKLWAFMFWVSFLPWLLFGIAARITAREAGNDRL